MKRVVIVILCIFSILFCSCKEEHQELVTPKDGFMYYEVTKGSSVGIKNAQGEVIVPTIMKNIEYQHVVEWGGHDWDRHCRYFICTIDKKGCKELYDSDGHCLIKKEKGYKYILPHYGGFLVSYDEDHSKGSDYHDGWCNVLGFEVLPHTFKSIHKDPYCDVLFCEDLDGFKAAYAMDGTCYIPASEEYNDIKLKASVTLSSGEEYFIFECVERDDNRRIECLRNSKNQLIASGYSFENRGQNLGDKDYFFQVAYKNGEIEYIDFYGHIIYKYNHDELDYLCERCWNELHYDNNRGFWVKEWEYDYDYDDCDTKIRYLNKWLNEDFRVTTKKPRASVHTGQNFTQTTVYPPQPNPTSIPFPSPTLTSNPTSTPSSEPQHGSNIKEETCPICHGTGTCETCLGRGWRNNPYSGQSQVCPTCNGNKICWKCNGTGKITKTVYY
jgi:hypothetical protein